MIFRIQIAREKKGGMGKREKHHYFIFLLGMEAIKGG